ncbi:MAG: methyl-accepting chemotaxis protein [Spirochaetota bacterium]
MPAVVILSFLGIIVAAFSGSAAEESLVAGCAAAGLSAYLFQLIQHRRRAVRRSGLAAEGDAAQNQKREELAGELRALKSDLASSQQWYEQQARMIRELSEKCVCVSKGSDITRTLTQIVQEKTEESTLEFTRRVYRVLEISEELNRSIQQVVGALSSEKQGSLTQDIHLLKDEQEKNETLIDDFIGIRDGYSAEAERIRSDMNSIGEFVGTINDLADRTNVLAINASIEAARAGRAGDGFAVIGTEIQKLSRSSKEVAERIHATIETSVTSVNDSVCKYNKRIAAAVNRLEQSGHSYAALIQKLKPQISELQQIVGTSNELSSQVHENVDEISVQLQYQDRIKQILDHLACILTEIGEEAHESAHTHIQLGSAAEEELYTKLVQRAACHFSCDEEYAAFGLQDDIGLQTTHTDKTDTKEEKFAGNVEMF